MKIFFLASIILNGVLGYLYFKEANKPPLEKTIVEEHTRTRVEEKKVYVRVPVKNNPEQKSETPAVAAPTQYMEFDPKAYESSVEKVTSDRESYMLEKLELVPEDLQKIEKVKTEFYKDADKLISQGEPTIEQRRQLLDLEEKREAEFSRVIGKEKWERFKKYRDDYNRKSYEKQADEQSVFIPMDI